MSEDTSSSLSKVCVLPSRWPPPEVAQGQKERQLAGPKPARAMQTAADTSLRCLRTPGLLPSFFQAVRCCCSGTMVLLDSERTDSPSPVALPLARPLEMAKVRGKPGTGDREMAVRGRAIYRGGWESRAQRQPGAAGPGGLRNPE